MVKHENLGKLKDLHDWELWGNVLDHTRNLRTKSYKCPTKFPLTCLNIDVGINKSLL